MTPIRLDLTDEAGLGAAEAAHPLQEITFA
jgi:hypothetical protein